MYLVSLMKLTPDFSETVEVRRQRDNILKVLKEKDCQPRILNLDKFFLKSEGKNKIFPEKQK